MVKVLIDQEGCISCGACVAVAPEEFEIDPKTGKARYIGSGQITSSTEQAALGCPVQVIKIIKDKKEEK
jgi:ferredoxin